MPCWMGRMPRVPPLRRVRVLSRQAVPLLMQTPALLLPVTLLLPVRLLLSVMRSHLQVVVSPAMPMMPSTMNP